MRVWKGPAVSPYEKIVRNLLRARACLEGTAADIDEAYKILGHDLAHYLTCATCGCCVNDHGRGGWKHEFTPRP